MPRPPAELLCSPPEDGLPQACHSYAQRVGLGGTFFPQGPSVSGGRKGHLVHSSISGMWEPC